MATLKDDAFFEEFNSKLRKPYVKASDHGFRDDVEDWREYLVSHLCLLSTYGLMCIVEAGVANPSDGDWSQVVVDTAASILLERAISDPVV